MIVETLEGVYGDLADRYQENNKSILDANRATAEYNDVMAELGKEMEPVTTEVKKGITEVVRAAMNLVDADTDKAVEKIGDAFEWTAENLDTIVSIAKVGTGIIGTMFAVNKAAQFTDSIKTLTTTMGLFRIGTVTATTATGAQTTAQLGLNAAMAANPVGLLITGFATLAAGIAIYCEATTSAEEELEEYRQEIQTVKDEADQMLESTREQIRGWQESIDSVDDNAGALKRLSDELYSLEEKEDKSISDKQRMKAIVEELNGSIDGLNLSLDEENYSLNMTSSAVNRNIDAMVKYKKAEIAMDNATQAAVELEKKERELTDSEEKLKKAKTETTVAQIRYQAAMDGGLSSIDASKMGMFEYGEAIQELKLEYDKAIETEGAAQEEYDKTETAVNELTDTYNSYMEMVGDTSAVEKTQKTHVEFRGTVYDVSSDVAESMQKLQDEYNETKKGLEESVDSQIGLFDELSLECTMSIDEMIANLKSQQEAMNRWAENVKKAAERGIDQGIIEKLNDGSVESAQILDEIVNSSDEKIQELNKAFAGASEAKDYLTTAMTDVQTGFEGSLDKMIEDGKIKVKRGGEDIGSNIASGIMSGVSMKESAMYEQMDAISYGILSAYKKSLKIKSPSRAFADASEYIPEGAALGVEENASVAIGAVENMARDMEEAYKPFDGISSNRLLEEHVSNTLSSRIRVSVNDNEGLPAAKNTQDLISYIERIASRPIDLYINDRKIAEATAAANDDVGGIRSSLKTRGLAL